MSGELIQEPKLIGRPFGKPTYRQISELNSKRAIHVSKAVAKINRSDGGQGTGFLIAPDILMTNQHIFMSRKWAQGAKVLFNYQKDSVGKKMPTDEYDCDPEFFHCSHEDKLDYAIVRLKSKLGKKAGDKWGFLKLQYIVVKCGDNVNIIQFPRGKYKEVAMDDNNVNWVDKTWVEYLTDTDHGSSGAPVFNDKWQLVALHHSTIAKPEEGGKFTYCNEGIRIGAIIKDLQKKGIELP